MSKSRRSAPGINSALVVKALKSRIESGKQPVSKAAFFVNYTRINNTNIALEALKLSNYNSVGWLFVTFNLFRGRVGAEKRCLVALPHAEIHLHRRGEVHERLGHRLIA